MDGAGTLALGLRLNSGVFMQSVWEDGAIAYVVLNDTDANVALTFSECEEGGAIAGCHFGPTVATWQLPRRSLRKITGPDALAISRTDGGMVGAAANGKKLGFLLPELPPFAFARAVVSNADINSTSGGRENLGQVETEFLVASETTFTVEIALPVRGALTLSSSTEPVEGFPFLDVVGARSDDATVEVKDGGFRVSVPEGASQEFPVRVAVDVRHPGGFAGKLVGFDAWFCSDFASSGDCLRGQHLQRAIPAEPPLP